MSCRVLLAGLLLSFPVHIAAKQQVILVGDDHYPPYSVQEQAAPFSLL